MSTSDRTSIIDAKDLLTLTELDGIRYYETSARRREDNRDTQVDIEIRLRRAEREIEVRCVARVVGEGADYCADASALFTLSEPVEITESALAEFVERVGVMTVYPYLRESIHRSAATLGVARPTMKLLRPGDIRLSVSEEGPTPSTK